jgi:hypothetical protein
LSRKLQHRLTFRDHRVAHLEPNTVQLDRALTNLYVLLDNDGVRVNPVGRGKVTKKQLVQSFIEQADRIQGFKDKEDLVLKWMESDILEFIKKGQRDERLATLKPYHLKSYKVRNLQECRDYGLSDHIYSMVREADTGKVLKRLRDYLGKQGEFADDHDDLNTALVLKMVSLGKEVVRRENSRHYPPLCIGQARVMVHDIDRLLTYAGSIPREIFVRYLKTLLGVHVGLYFFRHMQQLTNWVSEQQPHQACLNCPVDPHVDRPFADCPFSLACATDMGQDHKSRMASIARTSVEGYYNRFVPYIHAVFSVTALFQYFEDGVVHEKGSLSVQDIISKWNQNDGMFQGYFKTRVMDLVNDLKTSNGEIPKEMEDIIWLLPDDFSKYVQMNVQLRGKSLHSYFVRMMDSLLMKNSESGALRHGKGKSNGRRFTLGNDLMEALVQIAVLKKDLATDRYESKPMLIEEFMEDLRNRYGFVIDGVGLQTKASIEDYKAWRENIQHFKTRLRNIGFYSDLSDAYNVQRITPRYQTKQRGELQ